MSQFQMTPMDVIDKTGLGGFRAAMADNRSLQHSDSNLLSEQLLQEKTGLENETTKLNRPLDAVERARKIAESELQQKLLADGTVEKGARADVDMKIANAVGKLDDNQRKKVQDQQDATLRVYQMMDGKDDLFKQANWSEAVSIMHQAGITSFPKTWNPEAQARLDAAARAAWKTKEVMGQEHQLGIQHGNRLEQIGVEKTYQIDLEDRRLAAQAKEGAANRANQSAIAAAHDAVQREVHGGKRKIGETLEEANYMVTNKPSEATLEQVVYVEQQMRNSARTYLTADPASQIARLQSTALDPEAPEKDRVEAERKVESAVDKALKTVNGDRYAMIQRLKEQKKAQGQTAAPTASDGTKSFPAGAAEHLKANPHLWKEFEDKYGPGSAMKALGTGK